MVTQTIPAQEPMALTAQEVKAVMAVNAGWSYPGCEDGWVKAHNAIRADMGALSVALASCLDDLKKGKALQAWRIANLQAWWAIFTENVHHHHDNEELIVIPELTKLGVVMPAKMSADHPGLMRALDDVTTQLRALKPGQSADTALATFTKLCASFEALHSEMREHLQEEEDVALPLLRKHLTHKQWKPVEEKIGKNSNLTTIGWILHAMGSDQTRRDWMTHVAGIPRIIQALVMMPAARKYNRQVARLLEEVRTGQQTTQKRSVWRLF